VPHHIICAHIRLCMPQTFHSQEVDGSLVFYKEQPTEEFEEKATLVTEGVDEMILYL
jgi:hypothetical protein